MRNEPTKHFVSMILLVTVTRRLGKTSLLSQAHSICRRTTKSNCY